MNILSSLRRLFGQPASAPARSTPPPAPEPEAEVAVPAITPAELQGELRDQAARGDQPVLLDVRENHEWRLVHLPATLAQQVLHIPMNELPARLAELPQKSLVVLCAHGSRSYQVAHWLNQHGYQARNLVGGISRWAAEKGEVETAQHGSTASGGTANSGAGEGGGAGGGGGSGGWA